MKMIPLGSTDIKLSRMGLGTWAIGGGPAWNGDLDLQVCIDTIVEAHRCGINLIDTAPGYNFGNSEVIVGQALKKLPRNDIVVETNVASSGSGRAACLTKLAIVSCTKISRLSRFAKRWKPACKGWVSTPLISI